MPRRKEEVSYFFACSSCFSLDPCIVVEIGSIGGKCSWCSGREKVYLCERSAFSKNILPFVTFDVVRPKNTQGKGVALCNRILETGVCRFDEDNSCYFAHNKGEVDIWRRELNDSKFSRKKWSKETRSKRRVASTDGHFYCSACFLCFESEALYTAHILHDIHRATDKTPGKWTRDAKSSISDPQQMSDEFLNVELKKRYVCPENIKDYELDFNGNDWKTEREYVGSMHIFLYQEELKRKETLAKLDGIYKVEKCANFKNHIDVCEFGNFVKISMEESLFVALDEVELLHRNCKLVQVHLGNVVLCGRFKSLCGENVYLDLEQTTFDDEMPETALVEFIFDRELFCKFHYALDCLGDRVGFLCPNQNAYSRLAMREMGRDKQIKKLKLDDKQIAVLKHLDAEVDRGHQQSNFFPPLIVAGPFGTGKTHTISIAIRRVLQKGKNNTRVLLCTHSNSAANLYITVYGKDYFKNFKILRVFYHNRKLITVPKSVRQFCIFNQDMTAFRYPNFKEILSHNLIICTFTTAQQLGALGAGSNSGLFSHIFLDEASQTLETEVLIPITLAGRSTRIVMAGDHKQLTEKAFSRDGAQQPATLMERMYKDYEDGNKQSRIFFSNNYRTVTAILDVISRISYSGVNLTTRSELRPFKQIKPIQFHNVPSECEKTEAGDFENLTEVQRIVEFTSEIIKNNNAVHLTNIAVVTCYRSQVRLLRFEMRKVGLKQVRVDTVNNVQGMEFDILIISCVLTKPVALSMRGENLEFLSNPRLLNTSLTRAKRAVVVFGDAVTVSSVGSKECKRNWRVYLEECQKLKGIYPRTLTINVILKSIQNDICLNPSAVEFKPGTRFMLRNVTENLTLPLPASDSESDFEETDWISDSDEQDPNDYIFQEQIGLELGIGNDDDDDDEIIMPIANGPKPVFRGADPNEPNNYDRQDKPTKYEVHKREDLQRFLDNDPDNETYLQCRIQYITWDKAYLIPTNGENSFVLTGRSSLGRTFDGDLVVVRKQTVEDGGDKVIGVLQSDRNKDGKVYLCEPDEGPNLLKPVDKSVTKFILVRRKEHRSMKDSIPIYKPPEKNDCDLRKFDLVRHVKKSENTNLLYVVKYDVWMCRYTYPFGYVIKTIDATNTKEYLETMFSVPRPFPKRMKFPPDEIKRTNVIDMKEDFVFTIDPQGSVDLDDAVSIKPCTMKNHKDCHEIGIHITDVASKISLGSVLDKQARKRATTYYPAPADLEPTHMLPKNFIRDNLTLLPNQKRNAISIFLHSSQLPTLDEQHFFNNNRAIENLPVPKLTTIVSKRRLNYKEAEEMLDDTSSVDEISTKLKLLWKIFWNQRLKRLGGSAFSGSSEYEAIIEAGKAHLLIEEMMITYNTCIAHYLIAMGKVIPLRVQETPSVNEIETWQQHFSKDISTAADLSAIMLFYKLTKAREEGRNEGKQDLFNAFFEELSLADQFTLVETKTKKKNTQKRLKDKFDGDAAIVPHLKTKPVITVDKLVWEKIMTLVNQGDIIKAMMLWGNSEMQLHFQPIYEQLIDMKDSANMMSSSRKMNTISHFSLQLQFYTWASSPIRRYMDIVIQRIIYDVINNVLNPSGSSSNEQYVDALCAELSSKTKTAKKFEKESAVLNFGKSLFVKQRQVLLSVIEITEEFIQGTSQECKNDRFKTKAENLRVRFSDLDCTQDMPTLLLTNKHNRSLFSSADISWKFRFYDYKKDLTSARKPASNFIPKDRIFEGHEREVFGCNIPREIWSNLTEDIILQRNRSEENFHEHLAAMDVTKCDIQLKGSFKTCYTRNFPVPLPHKRIVEFELNPGDLIKVQLYGQSDRFQKMLPSIQLVWIGGYNDYHICVQHRNVPTSTFALEAKHIHPCNSVHQYVSLWEPVLRLDAVVCAVKEQNSFTLKGVCVQWNAIETKRGFVEEVDDNSEGNMHRVQLEYKYCAERYIRFSPSDVLCLRKHWITDDGERITQVLHGILRACKEKEEGNAVKLDFTICSGENRFPSEKVTESDWILEVIPIGVPFGQMYKALQGLKYFGQTEPEELIKQIIFGTITPTALKFSENVEERIDLLCRSIRKPLQGFNAPLNKKQAEEVEKALRQNFTMIQGPPGTGKSFMGAQLAVHYVHINRIIDFEASSQNHKSKVLYCGPSNKSVDVVADYLAEVRGVKTVRVYSKKLEEDDYPNPLKPHGDELKKAKNGNPHQALHHLIRSESSFHTEINEFDVRIQNPKNLFTRSELDAYSAKIMKAKAEVLQSADIIICTCGFSGLLSKFKVEDEMLNYRQCIIDECAMCTEPEVLVPLVSSKPDQIVFIGDHMQLEPVVTCKEAEELGLGRSLFSRLQDYSEMLEVQYRMHPTICEFPSTHFYNGKLQSDEAVMNLHSIFRQHVMFLNVKGQEKVKVTKDDEGGEHSKYNILEINAVLTLLRRMMITGNLEPEKVMVLSPYTAQCNKIKKRLRDDGNPKMRNVKVGSIVTSQGDQCDYVIFSTVRSQSEIQLGNVGAMSWQRKFLGFLSNPHQVNVALTRAKKGLCIIGNSVHLSNNPMWKSLIINLKKGAMQDNTNKILRN